MNTLKVGMAQISPVWLNKQKTIQKVEDYIHQAGDLDCDLIVFGSFYTVAEATDYFNGIDIG